MAAVSRLRGVTVSKHFNSDKVQTAVSDATEQQAATDRNWRITSHLTNCSQVTTEAKSSSWFSAENSGVKPFKYLAALFMRKMEPR